MADTIERLYGDPPSPWEEPYGFCRLVRVGRLVIVAGTTSVGPDGAVLGQTPYEQTREILLKLERELGRVGGSLGDVIQTRVYVIDIARSREVGRAHGESFSQSPPAMTMVQVSALVDPRMLVEIEAVALLQ
jgi:enamine deaminase RidA (YjgF/YER057c/UK114 family)